MIGSFCKEDGLIFFIFNEKILFIWGETEWSFRIKLILWRYSCDVLFLLNFLKTFDLLVGEIAIESFYSKKYMHIYMGKVQPILSVK